MIAKFYIDPTYRLLRTQVLYTMSLTYLPRPSKEELERLADAPSEAFPGHPRWHDFLAPEIRGQLIIITGTLEPSKDPS